MLDRPHSPVPTRAMTILHSSCGDATFVWDEEDDEEVEKIIEGMMKEGNHFFLIEPRLDGLANPVRRPLEHLKDVRKHRAIVIPTESLRAFFEGGRGDIISTPDTEHQPIRRAETAKEAASGETVVVRQSQGG